ncbi:hypothetical protein [Sphaerotilus sp.]|uniref:hypothetical protein n=1 Tax=Sphaerotilus sp. TaxID=2093942 RepID=UPI00286E3906|nr:hypothetical protein [Sphaerotilus sp.]
MRLQCPACSAEMDLDVLLAAEEGRHTLARLITLGTPMGAWTLRYIGLFRPEKRALSMSRTLKLLGEIWPDIERQAITRKGRDWAAPAAHWQAAIEQLLQTRDRGGLTLPMSSHGYLYEILVGIADKAEGQAERTREADRREPGHSALPTAAAPTYRPAQPAQDDDHTPVPAPDDVRKKLAATMKSLKGIPQ